MEDFVKAVQQESDQVASELQKLLGQLEPLIEERRRLEQRARALESVMSTYHSAGSRTAAAVATETRDRHFLDVAYDVLKQEGQLYYEDLVARLADDVSRPTHQVVLTTRVRRELTAFPVPAYELARLDQHPLVALTFQFGCLLFGLGPGTLEGGRLPTALAGHGMRINFDADPNGAAIADGTVVYQNGTTTDGLVTHREAGSGSW